jgi:hypothetical protein
MSTMTQLDATRHVFSSDRSRPSRRRAAMLAVGLLAMASLATACASGGSTAEAEATAVDGVVSTVVELHSAPGCDCCGGWEEYMTSHGFTVESTEEADLSAFKEARGVPRDAWSCHTAVIDGYILEGHVPVEAIEDLLADRPDIDGIALPGMPPGSPGMSGEKEAPFEVLAIDDGMTSSFGQY